MFFIWNERSRKPQYCFLIQAASWMIVTLLIAVSSEMQMRCSSPALSVYSAALPLVAYLRRHIKRLENLCEEHFPFVTVQKWRNAHSKMLLILQDRGFPEGQKSPSGLFCLGLDVTLQDVLVCLGLLQKGWGAGGFCFDGALWLWIECACYYDHCVMYITKLWKLISDT